MVKSIGRDICLFVCVLSPLHYETVWSEDFLHYWYDDDDEYDDDFDNNKDRQRQPCHRQQQ